MLVAVIKSISSVKNISIPWEKPPDTHNFIMKHKMAKTAACQEIYAIPGEDFEIWNKKEVETMVSVCFTFFV